MTGVLSPTALHPALGSPRDRDNNGYSTSTLSPASIPLPAPSPLKNTTFAPSESDSCQTQSQVFEQSGPFSAPLLPALSFSDHPQVLDPLNPQPSLEDSTSTAASTLSSAQAQDQKDTTPLSSSSLLASPSSLPLSASDQTASWASSQYQAHRSNSGPRVSASVIRHNKPDALSLALPPSSHKMIASVHNSEAQESDSQSLSQPASSSAVPSLSNVLKTSGSATPSQSLTDALNDLAKSRLPTAGATPTTARTYTSITSNDTATSDAAATILASTLQSPCFYHQRFADAVDIGKVLEEIKNDVSMSHSRLVATATGVREVSKQLQRRPIKRAVRNIMIVTKARDNQLVYLTRELAGWLLRTPRYGSDLGVNVYVDAKLRNSRRFDASGLLNENPRFQHMLKYWTPDLCWSQPEKFDLVLTLGGDGTVLFTSWLFQRIVPPVLSFSLGSLGFMTTFEFEKYKEHLNRVMGDDGMKINLRMRFTCTVHRNNRGAGALDAPKLEEPEQFEVLNELVIDRGPSPYVSNLELYGDDELLTVVQADGCIFSTPTGSTAYSLSAGGALVHPDIPAILLTPICPHTLSFRPMVLSDTMALRVVVPRNSRATAYCAFDGKGRLELRQGDCVTITASQYPFPTVTRTDNEWFDSVSRTLRWNVRASAQKPFDADVAEDGKDDDEVGWDIDTDSACYASEDGSVSASPIRRQMSLLGL
ncbi:NAD(+) kinase [Fusarium irregulare]|uniref:NAD(+) kinase n=1 Tax=Fusarium irregulare TaxID=2494466 RepID=A0A9W8U4M9_9HYPO|nr:NAD(+) kinase [Fusarium irregulare]KAJ4004168.1 NAD(+) kinase [Fusarium irregulare]